MIANGVQDMNGKVGEYLHLLRSLAGELERAMQAIAQNSLPELEDSVANQHALSSRLGELADELNTLPQERPAASTAQTDDGLMPQIRAASASLQALNQRYSALLHHSSRSVAMMVSLFNSFRGQIQEASGPRLKHQTWSCQG